jgi:hypothetical protein
VIATVDMFEIWSITAQLDIYLLKDMIQGHDRTLLERSEGYVRDDSRLFDELPSLNHFFASLWRERDIHPSGEFVLEVPCRLSVTHEN